LLKKLRGREPNLKPLDMPSQSLQLQLILSMAKAANHFKAKEVKEATTKVLEAITEALGEQQTTEATPGKTIGLLSTQMHSVSIARGRDILFLFASQNRRQNKVQPTLQLIQTIITPSLPLPIQPPQQQCSSLPPSTPTTRTCGV
jgi:hypothetical protein